MNKLPPYCCLFSSLVFSADASLAHVSQLHAHISFCSHSHAPSLLPIHHLLYLAKPHLDVPFDILNMILIALLVNFCCCSPIRQWNSTCYTMAMHFHCSHFWLLSLWPCPYFIPVSCKVGVITILCSNFISWLTPNSLKMFCASITLLCYCSCTVFGTSTSLENSNFWSDSLIGKNYLTTVDYFHFMITLGWARKQPKHDSYEFLDSTSPSHWDHLMMHKKIYWCIVKT